jgi:septum site-determining protein MinC
MEPNQRFSVTLKGVGDSLWVAVNPELSLEMLQGDLESRFAGLANLPANARVILDTGKSENSGHLFDELGRFLKSRFDVGEIVKPEDDRKRGGRERLRQRDMGRAWHNYRSEALIIAGRVRSGQKITARNHLIIMGDVNPGAEVTAGGDILVMGTLAGKAGAGQPENDSAIVMALQFRPTQVQIGGRLAAGISSSGSGGAEFARVEQQGIVVCNYLEENPFRQLTWPEVR